MWSSQPATELLTSICTPGSIDAAEDVGAVDLHPEVVAPSPQLDQLEDHLGVGAEVQLDLVADGDVLDRLGHEEAQPVAAVLAEDATMPSGSGVVPSFDSLSLVSRYIRTS